MGISVLALSNKRTSLFVGGIKISVGVLRFAGRLGFVPPSTGSVDVSRSPKAVIATGYGSERATDAMVLAWEPGMTETNDYGWDKLPTFGVARPGADGNLHLHAGPETDAPLTFDEAVAAGILTRDGKLVVHRRPRVASASVATRDEWTHANVSSLGPIVRRRDHVTLSFDNGTPDDELMPLDLLTDEARDSVAAGSLVGMTMDEVHEWLKQHRVPEANGIRVVVDGRLDFASGRHTAWMHPEYDDRRRVFGLVVGGMGGGSGMPRLAQDAFLDIGDRLARMGDSRITSVANGYVGFQAGNVGILVTGFEEGMVGVACGGPFPREFMRDTAMRRDAPDGAREGAAALLGWKHESIVVTTHDVGRFLADFALYLAECARAADEPGEPVPTFGSFLDDRGIEYGNQHVPSGPGMG